MISQGKIEPVDCWRWLADAHLVCTSGCKYDFFIAELIRL